LLNVVIVSSVAFPKSINTFLGSRNEWRLCKQPHDVSSASIASSVTRQSNANKAKADQVVAALLTQRRLAWRWRINPSAAIYRLCGLAVICHETLSTPQVEWHRPLATNIQ